MTIELPDDQEVPGHRVALPSASVGLVPFLR